MKTYIHNPRFTSIISSPKQDQQYLGLKARGMHRQQWGSGIASIVGKLARKAIPLLVSGAKLAKPHIVKSAKSIAKHVTKSVAEEATTRLFNKKRKTKHTPVRRRKEPSEQHHVIFFHKNVTHS